jgi:hypothetical protein
VGEKFSDKSTPPLFFGVKNMVETLEETHETWVTAERYTPQQVADMMVYRNVWFDIGEWESADDKTLADMYVELISQVNRFKYDRSLTIQQNQSELLTIIRDQIGADINFLVECEIKGSPYNGVTI